MGVRAHGFLNVTVASHLASTGAGAAEVVAVLDDDDPTAFELSVASLRWRDHEIGARTLQAHRRRGFHGFGSCSFAEPVADLVALGVPGVAS